MDYAQSSSGRPQKWVWGCLQGSLMVYDHQRHDSCFSHLCSWASCALSEEMNICRINCECFDISWWGKRGSLTPGHWYVKKHYPICNDLFLINIFPYLAHNPKVDLVWSSSGECSPPLPLGCPAGQRCGHTTPHGIRSCNQLLYISRNIREIYSL